ncbi:hypothetical protein BRADI_2g02653v3, partial [Brachypodium distachyon]
METPLDEQDRFLFSALTKICVNDGRTASFWCNAWLQGERARDIAPMLFQAARRKNRSVKDAITEHNWIRDIRQNFEHHMIHQFANLYMRVVQVHLQEDDPDTISWKLTSSGKYSAKSAYIAQFQGLTCQPFNLFIWKVWAPEKCRFFAWLL